MKHNRINSTKSPGSDASKVSDPRLMSQVERVREVVRVYMCVSAVRAVEVTVFVCLPSSCNHVTAVGGP
jgi:hypothetical protein